MNAQINNPTPGEILKSEFLDELGLSMSELARCIDVPRNRIQQIVQGRRGISADTDLRLSLFFGLSPGFWLRLQNTYDLMEAHRSRKDDYAAIKPFQYA